MHEDILSELKAMRAALDKIAASVVSEQAREELYPVWTCGHRHASRGDAIVCAQTAEHG